MEAKELRRIARENLAGNWGNAVLAAFLAALLGGLLSGGVSPSFEIDAEILVELPPVVQRYLLALMGAASFLGLVHFIIGGVIRQGYAVYLLKQHDRQNPETRDLFGQFNRFGDGFCLAFLQNMFTVLWTLLFIIPGIIKTYAYAMAPYIMAENPNMTARECLKASTELMDGHKADLFFLELSFFGWSLLNLLTLGIGSLWLNPYVNAAHAAFYRSITRPQIEA